MRSESSEKKSRSSHRDVASAGKQTTSRRLADVPLTTAEFGISRDDEVHVLTMLRDTLYSDKPLAVLREYSSNAWDAHRDAGKVDVLIEVTLPTAMEPTLRIRDHGCGISLDDMLGRFLKAGASTKRGSNNTVGTLGIGRLSGFAAMVEDVLREGSGEIVDSREARAAIGRRTAEMFKTMLRKRLTESQAT